MTQKQLADRPLQYHTVVISDTHLGKGVARADALVEFLEHTDCEYLVLNGDIFDGWYLTGHKHRKFSEMQMRVIDAINAKAHQGTKVVYVAGNHDENLRARWNRARAKLQKPKNKPGRHPILKRDHVFIHRDNPLIQSSIHIANWHRCTDPAGRSLFFIHGDQFDRKSLRTAWGKALSKSADAAYDGVITFNGIAAEFAKKHLPKRFHGLFSMAKFLKESGEKAIGIVDDFERAVATVAAKGKYDGIICGHTHLPALKEIKGVMYANSGDWVENCTALVCDEKGKWEMLPWLKKREEMGLNDFPTESDPNPNADYRGITQRQLEWVQRLWPASNLQQKVKRIQRAREQVLKAGAALKKAVDNAKLQKILGNAREALGTARFAARPY